MNSLSWLHIGMAVFFAFLLSRRAWVHKVPLQWREQYLESTKFTYRSLLTTVIIPVAGSLLLWLFLTCNIGVHGGVDGTIGDFIVRSTITPFWEEIAFRGLFLGFIFMGLINPWLHRKWPVIAPKFALLIAALFVTSVVFSFFHYGVLDIRYVAGLIYGIVYVIDRRNLVAPIISHATWNIIISVIAVCPIK